MSGSAAVFEIGEKYFTNRGCKVYLEATTTDGKYVVQQIIHVVDYYDEVREELGETFIADEIYRTAPVALIDEQFAAAKAKLDAIERKYQERYSAIVNAEADIKARFAKLAKFKGLENLEAFIDGRFSHFVVDDYSGIVVKTKEAALDQNDRHDKRLKLLSLFGDTNGDLTWNINQYRDGSGSSWRSYPCCSESEATAKAIEICTGYIDEWRSGKKNTYHLGLAEKSLKVLGVEMPSDAADALNAERLASANKEATEARQKLAAAETKLQALIPQAEKGNA